MISVFAYSSYRRFLADYQKEQRAFSPAFNHAKLAKKLGVGASTLKMIQTGARNLTVHHIHSFAVGMGLSPKEHDFFEALVLFEQSESAAEKRYYKKRLELTKKQSARSTRLNLQDVMKEWYIPAILIHLLDNKHAFDEAKVSARLGITPARVRETVDTLKRLGIVEVNKGQKIHFVLDKFAPHFSKQIYLKKLVPVLQQRIESEFHSPASYFESHTLSLSEAQFRGFLEDYKALLERYLAQDADGDTSVYQLFTSAFPVL
jgi:uncharacterized protein (TIGR02147 family)